MAVQEDPDLALIVRTWTNLPEPVRAGILAMVRAQAAADDAK